MPTVTQLKRMFKNQIASTDDSEFLRILTEADYRLLLYGRWYWTRKKDTLAIVDGIVTLPTTYASILAARVDAYPVDIMDEDCEFVPGGRGEIELGRGDSRLIDQGMLDSEDPNSPAYLTITGTLTDGTDPVVFPALQKIAGFVGSLGDCAYSSDGSETPSGVGAWYGVFVGITGLGSLEYNQDGSTIASWTDPAPADITDPLTWEFVADSPATGTPIVRLIPAGIIQQRQYKVTGYIDSNDVVTAIMHYAPVTLMDPDIADSMVPDDATVNTRCPDATALKLMMLGILMEEAHDHGGARSFISDALKSLDNKEQSQRGNAQRTVQSRPMGRNVRSVRGWR